MLATFSLSTTKAAYREIAYCLLLFRSCLKRMPMEIPIQSLSKQVRNLFALLTCCCKRSMRTTVLLTAYATRLNSANTALQSKALKRETEALRIAIHNSDWPRPEFKMSID